MRLNGTLPAHLHPCVTAQKRAMLRSLHDVGMTTNDIAYQQLTNLLTGTLSRGEGNSCMVLGPCGSGKTKLVERCLSDINESPIVLRLSGWIQYSDRLAMREIAHQLAQQTGSSFLSNVDDVTESFPHQEEEEEANPFLDTPPDAVPVTVPGISLPPSSHLPALISILPTLARPTVVILDAFDLFALHPRQSLLYCLLDTVQSCRASPSTKGIAVIGVTSRVDTIQLLEKRVKSRFSGRTFRTAAPQQLEDWVKITKTVLSSKCTSGDHDNDDEWQILWQAAVDKFMSAKTLLNALNETFSITRDVRMLKKLITMVVTHISPRSPYPLPTHFTDAATLQRARPRFPFLYTLSYPALCLLIASIHADTAGHPVFSFEMLHETFRDQVRTSASAPIQINGGSIGMAFEALISAKIFVCAAAPTTTVVKEFIKYRCVVERDEVKKTVDKTGQINLKKWLNRAQ
ncbi:origin recognition complex subunit 4 C-terminus-domain-containing protein [Crucibulum laeve]|uniref:Origin recognition complex subunit 4 C-terminus-domain-containing protein n=1 Tax=Crucibulum laeve TaxID=68775 RepID=A0A5C3MDU9_9AGAR|nr:origin recognition complex subunit 4 C-terminus-domain-containing protein [Crucibulum laeve]